MTTPLPQLALVVAVLGLASACNPTSITCRAGTDRCGLGCADFSSDNRNCGGCGRACAVGQACVAGACACQAGAAACAGSCAVLSSDPANCGACGRACPSGRVCEAGQCIDRCSAAMSFCDFGCVDVQTSPQHCGGCGQACGSAQRCVAGRCTYDLVAACFRTGQLVGVSAGSFTRGVLREVGNGPGALAVSGDTVLSLDGIDNALYQAVASAPGSEGGTVLAQRRRRNATGAVPNQVVVQGGYAYVANAGAGTLQVLKLGVDGGGLLDAGVEGGVALGTVAELPLGANTFPQGVAVVGSRLYVPLYGGVGSAEATAGQRVLKVDVANPEAPRDAGSLWLGGVDLKAFDGGAALPRPWAVTTHAGAAYVALNNLGPDYQPAGPGLVVRVDPTTDAVDAIDLGRQCLNPQWLASLGSSLAVSCGGQATYDSSFSAVAVTGAGLAVVDRFNVVSHRWVADCAADAGCRPFSPGRFAVRDGQVWLADQNSGRLAVLDVRDGGLTAVRAPGAPAGALDVCPAEPGTALANVADVLALP